MGKRFFSSLALVLAVVLVAGVLSAEAAVDWREQTVSVTGQGVAPMTPNPAQAKMLARRAAIADAYRLLAELVQGVQVDSETNVEMMMVKSDTIRTKVSAMIKGAKVVSEGEIPGGGYEVTLSVPMFGVSNSIAAAVLTPPAQPANFPPPAPNVIPSMPADSNTGGSVGVNYINGGNNSPMGALGGFTGVIIDCRGLGLNPVMSPVIINADGVKIYGHENLNFDLIIDRGMADYAQNDSMTARAGSNPLRIRAQRLEGHNANPVVSVADGNRILIENGVSGFLNNTAVVFLY